MSKRFNRDQQNIHTLHQGRYRYISTRPGIDFPERLSDVRGWRWRSHNPSSAWSLAPRETNHQSRKRFEYRAECLLSNLTMLKSRSLAALVSGQMPLRLQPNWPGPCPI